MVEKILKNLTHARSAYVVINVMLSAVGLVRSFFCLRILGFQELGSLTIFQNLAFIGSLFQLGLISGAYRIYTLDESQSNNLHNTIVSFLLAVLSAFSAVAFIAQFFKHDITGVLVFSGIFLGVLALYSNWLISTFLARSKLKELNKINLLSMVVGLATILLIYQFGLTGAILSILAQPLSFIAISLVRYPALRPTKLMLSKDLISKSLSYGFIPFVAGILFFLNAQIERWSIAYFLNTESLGKFFLATLFSTIFILVPNSLNNIFFPKALNFYANKDYDLLKIALKKFYVLLVAYDLVCVASTLLFLRPLVSMMFPNHIPGIELVYTILPGLVAVSFVIPIFMTFNFSLTLKPILAGYILSTIIMLILMTISIRSGSFSISTVALIESISNACLLCYAGVAYSIYYRKIWT